MFSPNYDVIDCELIYRRHGAVMTDVEISFVQTNIHFQTKSCC